MTNTICFLYGRCDSKRLPNKLMREVVDKKLIDIVYDRAARLPVSDVVLLTTDRLVDQPLVDHFKSKNRSVFRGAYENVVKRTEDAIRYTGASRFIRVNGDSPLIEPMLYLKALSTHTGCLTSNLFRRTFPYGVAVEAVDTESYSSLAYQATKTEQEHTTAHLYRLVNELEDCLSLENLRDDSHHSLTIDTEKDFNFFRRLAETVDLVKEPYWKILDLKEPEIRLQHLA